MWPCVGRDSVVHVSKLKMRTKIINLLLIPLNVRCSQSWRMAFVWWFYRHICWTETVYNFRVANYRYKKPISISRIHRTISLKDLEQNSGSRTKRSIPISVRQTYAYNANSFLLWSGQNLTKKCAKVLEETAWSLLEQFKRRKHLYDEFADAIKPLDLIFCALHIPNWDYWDWIRPEKRS